MTEPGKIEFSEVPEPKPGKGQILLRVKQIGVCGSDVHVSHGKHPFTSYPVVQGHEFSGVVEAIGQGVEGIEIGTKATARPQLVRKEINESFYRIIEEYYKLTGNPSIINTSFNMHEEPIVCTPTDAIRAFKLGHLHYLAMGPFLVKGAETG